MSRGDKHLTDEDVITFVWFLVLTAMIIYASGRW